MLLNFSDLITRHSLNITGIIQVGCHHCQEVPTYHAHGIRKLVLIEPCAAAFKIAHHKYGSDPYITLLNFACGSYTGEASMFVETANQGQSNSLLKPKNHMKQYPDIKFRDTEMVQVRPLDALPIPAGCNMLNIDTQCSEMQVLTGAKRTLDTIDYIMSEVNAPGAELYEGCTDINEMDAFLSTWDFVRVEEPKWINGTWSDSFWIKKRTL